MQIFPAAKNLICSKHVAVVYPHEHLSAELAKCSHSLRKDFLAAASGSPGRSLSLVLSVHHILGNHRPPPSAPGKFLLVNVSF